MKGKEGTDNKMDHPLLANADDLGKVLMHDLDMTNPDTAAFVQEVRDAAIADGEKKQQQQRRGR